MKSVPSAARIAAPVGVVASKSTPPFFEGMPLIISTVAGTGSNSFSGDGGAATSASLNSPSGLTLDSSGNIYIADRSNKRIRKV